MAGKEEFNLGVEGTYLAGMTAKEYIRHLEEMHKVSLMLGEPRGVDALFGNSNGGLAADAEVSGRSEIERLKKAAEDFYSIKGHNAARFYGNRRVRGANTDENFQEDAFPRVLDALDFLDLDKFKQLDYDPNNKKVIVEAGDKTREYLLRVRKGRTFGIRVLC